MRKGISWTFASQVATNVIRIAVIAILARILDSADFGVVAAAVSVNVILYSIRDVGISTAIVQRRDIEPGHLKTAFAVSTYIGLAFSALLFVAAPLIAKVYGLDGSTGVLRAMGALFSLLGVSAVSRSMLTRAMDFRAIATIDAVAFAGGAITTVTLAVCGAGPWALVGGYLLEELLTSGLFLAAAPPLVSFRIERARLRELMTVGVGQTIVQIAGILATYGDNFVVGRMLGARALGFYTRAYDLIKYPSTVFGNIVGAVLAPAFARLQDDRPALAKNFRRMLFINALILLPASGALFVLAPEAIRILMGPKWDPAVLPFRVLTLTMLSRTTLKLGAIVATAAGAVNGVAIAYVIYMVAVIGGALVAIQWSIVGVATTTAIAITLTAALLCFIAMKISTLSFRALVAAHVPGLTMTVAVVAVAWPLAEVLRGQALPAALVFGLVGALAVAVSLGVLALWMARRTEDLAWLGEELRRLVRRRAKRPA